MKKIILTLMLCCGFVIAAQAQVLYRISGNGLTKPSYIIGSHHLANVAFVNQIPGAKMALDSTEQVYGELKMDPNSMQATQQEIMKNMMLGEGQKINQVLSADQMKRVNAFMMKTMQTDFNNPAVMQQMGSMKPAALSTNFTVLLYLTHHMGEFDPTSSFDQYFQRPVAAVDRGPHQSLYGPGHSRHLESLRDQVEQRLRPYARGFGQAHLQPQRRLDGQDAAAHARASHAVLRRLPPLPASAQRQRRPRPIAQGRIYSGSCEITHQKTTAHPKPHPTTIYLYRGKSYPLASFFIPLPARLCREAQPTIGCFLSNKKQEIFSNRKQENDQCRILRLHHFIYSILFLNFATN